MSEAMTQAQQRAHLVAIIGGVTATVDGVDVTTSAHPTQPPAPQAYDTWPIWVATREVAMCVDETDWTVVVALPGPDPQTAATAADELVTAMREALDAYGRTRVEPVGVQLAEGQAMPGVAISLTI